MKLYEIVKELEKLSENMIDYETGEINIDIEKKIEDLKLTYDEKLSNIWKLLKNMEAEEKALSYELKKLSNRKKAISNSFERLKTYASSCLEPGKIWKSENGLASFSWRESTKCEIFAPELIPEKYIELKREPIKSFIKDDLKSGIKIVGAKLIEQQNLVLK